MKKFFLVFIVMLISLMLVGCMGIESKRVFLMKNAEYDEAFRSVTEAMTSANISIDSMDKASGLIAGKFGVNPFSVSLKQEGKDIKIKIGANYAGAGPSFGLIHPDNQINKVKEELEKKYIIEEIKE